MVFKSRCARVLRCLDGEICGKQSGQVSSENIHFQKGKEMWGVAIYFFISKGDSSKVMAISVNDYFGKN